MYRLDITEIPIDIPWNTHARWLAEEGEDGCTDLDSDSTGNTEGNKCDWYDENSSACNTSKDDDDFRAMELCCECGGGWTTFESGEFGKNKVIDFDADYRCSSSDIGGYDLEEWNLSVIATSAQSTHASRESGWDHKLTLKDVCWDLPLVKPELAQNSHTMNVWEQTEFSFTGMSTEWDNYCGGFSYEIIY